MKLTDYPDAIADLQRQLLRTEQHLRQLSESVTFCTAAIDRQIAFDSELRNDSQRKARRAELLESDPDYITATNALKAAQDQKAELEIELGLLRNQFSLLKLEKREAIAVRELQLVDAA